MNPYLPKSRTKIKVLLAHAKSQLRSCFYSAHCTTSSRHVQVDFIPLIFFWKSTNCLQLFSVSLLCFFQRWSPRGRPWPRECAPGYILKSLALASKPQVLENCPVFGLSTALFFELFKLCRSPKIFLEDVFLWRSPEKKNF